MLVVLLKQVEPEDPVGIVYAGLMGVALVGNFVAGVAAAASAAADRRREAELSSELAHTMLRAGDLQSAADGAGRRLAAAFNLRSASVVLTEAAGDHRRGVIPLHEDDVLFGVLEVPDGLPRTTLERLLRVVPTLEALLAAARDREKVNNTLIESRHRLELFFELTSDLMVISDQGKLLEVNPAFEKALGYTLDDLAAAPFELVPPEDMDRLREPIKDLTEGRGPVRFENRASSRDGSSRWIEWSVAPHQGLFYAVGRDVTGQREEEEQLRETRTMLEASRERLRASRDRLRQLARHQTALRRVAELVAREAEPGEVFNAVAEEMADILDVYNATVGRYEGDDIVIAAIARTEIDLAHPPVVGERFPLDGDHVAVIVRRTGRPARIDSHKHAAGASAARIREMGVESMVAVPIMVGEQLWGVAAVASRGDPLPADTEVGIADFADLVATAIANAAAREQLNTSRDSLRQLARQQTALRRVAELVARGTESGEVFAAVAEDMADCLDAFNATVARFEGDEIVIEAIGRPALDLPSKPAAGDRFPLDGDHIAPIILRTGRPARMDNHEHGRGATSAYIRGLGIQSMVGVPIVVGAHVWGLVAVASGTGPLPADTEARMADFADLVGTSIANAATRSDLQA
ncbi:MAG TPA: GAF domain-containing protein, partial [Mycobacterium sp.]|nr:GAF domain-containing protein [Mycobacterium sp.]